MCSAWERCNECYLSHMYLPLVLIESGSLRFLASFKEKSLVPLEVYLYRVGVGGPVTLSGAPAWIVGISPPALWRGPAFPCLGWLGLLLQLGSFDKTRKTKVLYQQFTLSHFSGRSGLWFREIWQCSWNALRLYKKGERKEKQQCFQLCWHITVPASSCPNRRQEKDASSSLGLLIFL